MARLSNNGDQLHIELSMTERILGLHRRDVEVPLSAITDVVVSDQIRSETRGLRMPGTGIPWLLAIGTWRGRKDGAPFRDLVLIRKPGPGVVINLSGGRYRRILLSADDPHLITDVLPVSASRAE